MTLLQTHDSVCEILRHTHGTGDQEAWNSRCQTHNCCSFRKGRCWEVHKRRSSSYPTKMIIVIQLGSLDVPSRSFASLNF